MWCYCIIQSTTTTAIGIRCTIKKIWRGEKSENFLTKAYLASGCKASDTAFVHSSSFGVSLKKNASLLRSSSWKLKQQDRELNSESLCHMFAFTVLWKAFHWNTPVLNLRAAMLSKLKNRISAAADICQVPCLQDQYSRMQLTPRSKCRGARGCSSARAAGCRSVPGRSRCTCLEKSWNRIERRSGTELFWARPAVSEAFQQSFYFIWGKFKLSSLQSGWNCCLATHVYKLYLCWMLSTVYPSNIPIVLRQELQIALGEAELSIHYFPLIVSQLEPIHAHTEDICSFLHLFKTSSLSL